MSLLPKKIIVIGPKRSGKTTLIRELRELAPSIEYIERSASDVIEPGNPPIVELCRPGKPTIPAHPLHLHLVVNYIDDWDAADAVWKARAEAVLSNLDCLLRLHTIVQLLEFAGRWHPMETAPKDGTRILVDCGGIVCTATWAERYGTGLLGRKAGWFNDDAFHLWPVAWQPLPAGQAGQATRETR